MKASASQSTIHEFEDEILLIRFQDHKDKNTRKRM